MTDYITTEIHGQIGRIILNRPEKRNAVSRAMWRAIPAAIAALDRNDKVRVIILQGAGAHFAAGADIAEFDDVYATRASAAAYAGDLAAAMDALAGGEKPRIAVIQGVCVGGGVALALCCDLRFAADDARFAITPARLGLAYSFADTRRLVTTVGAAAARDLLFSARTITAAEALALRLVDRLHPAAELHAQAHLYARSVGALSSGTIRVARNFVARTVGGQITENADTYAAYLDLLEGPDFLEGKRAFKEKRLPEF